VKHAVSISIESSKCNRAVKVTLLGGQGTTFLFALATKLKSFD